MLFISCREWSITQIPVELELKGFYFLMLFFFNAMKSRLGIKRNAGLSGHLAHDLSLKELGM